MQFGTLGRLTVLALGALALMACETLDVERVQPAEAPVAFSTYAWGQSSLNETPGAAARLVELDEDLRDTVAALMQSRGYRLVEDPTTADMVMDYQVAIFEEEFAGDGDNPSWDAQFDSNAQRGVVELPSQAGAPRVILTLGLGRPGGRVIWGGNATKLLARPENREERRRVLNAAVQELLRDLPAATY
ncbi:DUF4136 domain-containing protein [Microbulbifer guangxiensis]|uniref:DUF4136 domain-containing protein n=1 Tax=Microbulbifer guangxiensis TaxID=2904249 RepID=UPI001F40257F|nr:DUF4136 domain-containing protein [Microbulbifer guangxiensis]